MTTTFSNTPFAPLEEHVRRNMEMFERTFAMFKPFGAPLRKETPPSESPPTANEPAEADIDDLKRQMKEMQDRLERMSKETESKG
jgi:polyhydroxyalkanoate synthesis regulator protein